MAAWLALIDPLSRLLERVIPDPDARAKAQLELVKEQNQQALKEIEFALRADEAQTAINAEEAKSSSVFVAGWRPFIGWICGVAFAYHFIVQPFLAFAMASLGHQVTLPVFDMDALFTVLLGMLGLGGMRSFEKVKGVTK